ncbi:MAG: ATP-binding protein [Acidobacteriota bacterium]|nr:ATP-binding protein [Acidobacteriota bacterium]
MFVDREKEKNRLLRAFERDNTRLIVVYGRRRCGKTALLRRILPPKAVYFAADLRETALQISGLADRIDEIVPGFGKPVYPDWESLFNNLGLALRERTILCLDEFPYLVKNSPDLPSVIQKIVDAGWPHILILCGSSQQMMYGMALDGSSPLYGRCDEILRIRPMEIPYLKEYLRITAEDAVREFGVWGGVPRYWEIRRRSKSFEEAVKNHVLDRDGILYEEPERLFADEMRTSVQAFSVLSLIGSGCHRMSEIAGRLEKPATQLSRLTAFLIDLGYIRRDVPYGESIHSTKKSLYKIDDPFLNFYFTFLVPHRSRLEFGLIDPVWNDIRGRYDGYLSGIWEDICRRAVPLMTFQGKTFNPAARWWGNGLDGKPMELDLVAESIDKSAILLGEVEWRMRTPVAKLQRELERKSRNLPFAGGKSVIKALFLRKADGEAARGAAVPDETTLVIPPGRVVSAMDG